MAIVEGLRLIHRKNELVAQAKEGTLTDAGRTELFEKLKECREWLGIKAERLAQDGEIIYGDEEHCPDETFQYQKALQLKLGEVCIPYGRLCYNKDEDEV